MNKKINKIYDLMNEIVENSYYYGHGEPGAYEAEYNSNKRITNKILNILKTMDNKELEQLYNACLKWDKLNKDVAFIWDTNNEVIYDILCDLPKYDKTRKQWEKLCGWRSISKPDIKGEYDYKIWRAAQRYRKQPPSATSNLIRNMNRISNNINKRFK